MRTLAVLVCLLTPGASACQHAQAPANGVPRAGRGPRSTAASSKGPGTVQGTVHNAALVVRDAAFFYHHKANDLTIILSDRPGLCATVNAGAMPRQTTILNLVLKLNTRERQDGPFTPGDYPLRTAAGAKHAQDLVRAVVLKLDHRCKPTLPPRAARAVSGSLTLSAVSATPGGKARGTFSLTFGEQGDKVLGGFDATYCQQPPGALEPSRCQ